LNFFYIFLKIPQISNFEEICPVVADLLHADRRTDGHTDMMTLIVAFGILRKHLKMQVIRWMWRCVCGWMEARVGDKLDTLRTGGPEYDVGELANVEVVPLHTMKAYRCRGIVAL
jgi:hypothetical protein